MGVRELAGAITDNSTVRRVFGEPIERDGALIIPVATFRGAVGGGDGMPMTDEPAASKGLLSGWGGGGMWSATPAGVYVVKDGETTWLPVVDVNRSIMLGCLTGITALLVLRSVIRALVKRG